MLHTLKDVWDIENTQRLHEDYGTEFQIKVIQTMHKENGGSRKLQDAAIELRLQVMGAFAQISWESIGVRGIYYRVVSIYGLPKTEKTYKRVQAEVLSMRRDCTLNYSYIVDGSRHTYGSNTYDNTQEFLENVAHAYRRDIWSDSRFSLEVTVEKGAMRDILLPITKEFGVSLSPTSGFNSESAWYQLAERYKYKFDVEDKIPVLLMMTDYDTAGLQMVESAKSAFTRFDVPVVVRHVGLTPKDIKEFKLLTREDKVDGDMKACELDAMTPEEARLILRRGIEEFADLELFAREREQEERERMTLVELARGV